METRNPRYGSLISALLLSWLIIVISAAKLLVFKDGRVPAGFAALTPIVIFVLWSFISPGFRQFIFSLDTRTLTLLQAWRVAGFVWFVAAAYGILPGAFAQPAGWGDLAVGLSAPFVAIYLTKLESRRGLLVWQTLGLLDLIMAVTLGVLASPRIHLIGNGMTTAALTVLPLSIIPTFGVPLAIIFHIVCIVNLSRSEQTRRTSLEHPVAPHSVSITR